jgi:hypothetical protein
MPRARAVADAPVERLLAAGDELARRWLVALVAARPLEQIADLPLEALALQAPALCRQLVHALGSDAELQLLLGDGDRRPALEGSTHGSARHVLALVALDASTLAASVEALRAVVWRRALAELSDPPAALVADLGDRLAFVCASLLAVALDAGADGGVGRAAPRGGSARAPYGRLAPSAGRSGAVLIDELEAEPRPLADAGPARESRQTVAAERTSAGGKAAGRGARARPWDTPLRDDRSAAAEPVPPASQPSLGDEEPQLRVRRTSAVPIDELR